MFNSLYFGLVLSLFMYFLVDHMKRWIKTSLFNPLLISSTSNHLDFIFIEN